MLKLQHRPGLILASSTGSVGDGHVVTVKDTGDPEDTAEFNS